MTDRAGVVRERADGFTAQAGAETEGRPPVATCSGVPCYRELAGR